MPQHPQPSDAQQLRSTTSQMGQCLLVFVLGALSMY